MHSLAYKKIDISIPPSYSSLHLFFHHSFMISLLFISNLSFIISLIFLPKFFSFSVSSFLEGLSVGSVVVFGFFKINTCLWVNSPLEMASACAGSIAAAVACAYEAGGDRSVGAA